MWARRDMLLARGIVFVLFLLVIALAWQAGALRERLGWSSGIGNIVWWVLGFPGFLFVLLCQVLLYQKITAENPFDDRLIVAMLVAQATIGLVIIFYYGIKNYHSGK
jgi:hypothetical protein